MRGSLPLSLMLVTLAAFVASLACSVAAGDPNGVLGRPSAAPTAAREAPNEIASSSPTPSLTTAPTMAPPVEISSTAAPTPAPATPVASGYRITIPRLGIDLGIREGDVTRDIDEQHTPENYAFHLPGTAWPGMGGNTFLYAHARTGMFLSLWNARLGDEVFVFAPDGRLLVYVVRDIFPRVVPTDVSSTLPTTAERLTLQTSTGPSPSDPRFVVFAFPRGG